MVDRVIERVIQKFREGLEQSDSYETPDIFPMLELLESLERLKHIGEGYANHTSNVGICGACGSVVPELDRMCWG